MHGRRNETRGCFLASSLVAAGCGGGGSSSGGTPDGGGALGVSECDSVNDCPDKTDPNPICDAPQTMSILGHGICSWM